MAVPIVYVAEYAGLAGDGQGGIGIDLVPQPPIAQYAVLCTVGGLLTFTLTSRGSALTSGTYTNQPVVAGAGVGATVTYGVSSTGQLTTMSVQNPGYLYTATGLFAAPLGVIGTAGSVLTTITIASVLPCGPPMQPATKFVEVSVDANAPALLGFSSTLVTSYNGVLTTTVAQLTTTSGQRLSVYDRVLRGVNVGNPTLQAQPATLQVIIGTAAA